jgi:hypothetical protein
MNPARSLGPALVSRELGSLWIYLTAPLVGAVVAAALYQVLLGRGRVQGVTALQAHDAGTARPADLGGSTSRY